MPKQYNGISDLLEQNKQEEIKKEQLKKRKEDLNYYKQKKEEEKLLKFEERNEHIKSLDYVKDLKGMFCDDLPISIEDRRLNFLDALDQIEQMNAIQGIKKGQTLSMSRDWKNKLKRLGNKMFDYLEQLDKPGTVYSYENQDKLLQGLLNSQFKNEKGNENADATLEQYKELYTQINLIENLIYDENMNYTSSLNTRAELQYLDEYSKSIAVSGDGSRAKAFEENDVMKIVDFIEKKNKGDYRNSPDAHIVAILGIEFGMRRSTIEKLTINDIDVKNGIIRVPVEKNKSGVSYIAKPISEEINGILGQIVQRSYEKNYEKTDNNGEIKIIGSSKSNQYKEFDRLLDKVGLKDKYKDNKFHALRRYFGQTMYDIYRNGEFYDNKRGAKYIVNELLGHNKSELKNLDSYVQRMW